MSRVQVVDNRAEGRYELLDGDERVGEIVYREGDGVLAFVHTEVRPRGTGLGGELVEGALDDVRARGLRVVPVCPFVGAYVRRHPEYADLLALQAE